MAGPYKTHGITTETKDNIILDAGAVYINYGEVDERLLGATSGGNSFSVEREIKVLEVDGAKGKVKGLRRITEHNATLTVNMIEMSAENLKLALGAADLSDVMDQSGTNKIADKITPRNQILDSDYVKNIALVATVSGTNEPCVIIIYNALSDDELELELEDKEEGVLEVTFSAHYDPANLDQVPYEIRYPVVDTP